MLWVVTPRKCGAQVKRRLGEAFSTEQRLRLSRAMACDVLEALGMAALAPVMLTQTVMHGAGERRALARDVPEFAAELGG